MRKGMAAIPHARTKPVIAVGSEFHRVIDKITKDRLKISDRDYDLSICEIYPDPNCLTIVEYLEMFPGTQYARYLVDHNVPMAGRNVNERIVMMRTDEDWYPNFEGDYVYVSLILLPASGKWRVCVWGADDAGMEKDFHEGQLETARSVFNQICTWQRVQKGMLQGLGFGPA